jgi:probable rRNA maturation factor
MNAIVEISNDCSDHWVPEAAHCQQWIQSALDAASLANPYCVSLRFVDLAVGGDLNNQYRGREKATNVLSFPAQIPPGFSSPLDYSPLGDIVLCPPLIEQEAEQQGKTLPAHWAHLLIHGLLHLVGYDHDSDDDAESMEKLEIDALERLGFPNPYLIG